MVYPDAIGTDQAQILVAEDQGEFDHWQRYLDMMAGDLRYVGANLRAAAALGMALLSRLLIPAAFNIDRYGPIFAFRLM